MQTKVTSFATTQPAADGGAKSTSVKPSSGSSKRRRSLSPDASPSKRHQSGRSEAGSRSPEPDEDLAKDQTIPPTGVDGLIWAFKRQPLCDAQAYFRAHQGGTYTKNREVQGMLVAGSVEIRDFLEKHTLVTSCGGGREQTSDGSWVRAPSKQAPKTWEYWKKAQADQRAILMVIGSDNPAFKNLDLSSIPEGAQYVVLGAFFVTELWQEMGVAFPKTNKGGNLVEYAVYKVKMQRVDLETTPVYWKDDVDSNGDWDVSTILETFHCQACSVESPRAFEGKKLCLNRECREFFHEDGKSLSARDPNLQYSRAFIKSTKPFTGDIAKAPTGFQPPPVVDKNGWGSEKAFRMGMVCPDCGCCNSRAHWNFWKCINCGYKYTSEPKPYPMSEVHKENKDHCRKKQLNKAKSDQITISMDDYFVSKFSNAEDPNKDSTITTYMIVNRDKQFLGSVVHERPSKATLQMPGGSDILFQEAQESMDAMKLKRNPARCVDSRIEVLTKHFSHNFGTIYEFGVTPDNTAFRDAPDIILKSLAQLTHFGQRAVASSQQIFSSHEWNKLKSSTIMDPWVAPNELLALAYMEDDSISYHDDGEEQLNGVISTLSLGSPAVMKLRLKKEKRSRKTGKKTDQDDKDNTKGDNKPILEIQLRHGDVVTMCDTQLQAFTEHTVQPAGLRRYAMTSRFINTQYYEKGKPAEKLRKWNMTTDDLRCLGELPSRAAQFSFKGTHLQPHNSI